MNTHSNSGLSLVQRILKAGTWTLAGYGAGQLLRLISNLVMTRLLIPEMFGIMALSQVFLYIMTLISDIGINHSIIRSTRGDEPAFLNTAWVVQIIRSMIVTAGVLIIAFCIYFLDNLGLINQSSAFGNPQLPIIIAVMSLSSAIGGFVSTNVVLARRKLQLGRITVLELISQIIGIIIMVTWAYNDRSIWALVVGTLATSIIFVILSHTAVPGLKNKFQWESSAFWEIFHFGKWLMLSSIVTAFYVQGDRLFFGAYETAEVIGIYSIACFLSAAVQGILLKINNLVFYPILSEIKRENGDNILYYYYRIRKNTDAISIFFAGLLFCSAGTIIEVIYDDRYLDASWMLAILSLTLLFTGPITSSVLMLAIGQPKFDVILRSLQLAVLFATLPFLYFQFGMYGAIWSAVIVAFCSALVDIAYRNKHDLVILKYELRMYPIVILGYLAGLVLNEILLAIYEVCKS